ncbi:hypothetical protein JRO89_XS13G0162400 [Xanthoceras sorbifolium]|uniref:BHLH domain-containing protein n=1 Tax=Xanthoceras sorbifolium TaxID=99658 RepID=A0ABQ8H8M9_9ROSI|nr:hypothetical protein JRO89_XS13G0162400 [Xanthoceras sorbifolium]
MATTGLQNQERVPENLKKQLALAVRSIQWSYAIFWSISAGQPGVLEWGDGYYNGDIKTRKTIQAGEFNSDQLGLQRSEQLRELYESLSAGESNPQASRRPSAALSPEDLTDTEWYYLVCMSFLFNIGEGLPGRALANGQPIWLCNAHYADSKVFGRSLLAKSASIQTVVCFPFLQGVVELGATDLVLEDLSFIQQVKSSFLEIPYPIISKKSSTGAGNVRNDKDLACSALDQKMLDTTMIPVVGCEVLEMTSPNDSSYGIEPNQPAEDSFMANGVASQVQNWQFIDDEFSNCIHHSMNSSDCISQTFVDPGKVVCAPKDDNKPIGSCLQEVLECNDMKLTSLDLRGNDLHYQSVLSALLKTSHQLILGPHFRNCNQESSFISWKKGGLRNCKKQRDETPQKLLKKILFEVPRMDKNRVLESSEDNGIKDDVCRPEADEFAANLHVLSERRRREKLNERFITLKSLVPSISKFDKVSILDDTIIYLQELERKVEELESRPELPELVGRTKRKPKDTIERTSDNYGNNKISNGKKPPNKRKACDIDEMEPEIEYVVPKDGSTDNITVSTNDKNVLIEIRCPWREGILIEIMDAVSNLHLDSHSVQSSTTEEILSATIKSKYKGLTVASAGKIRQSLHRVVWKC